MTARDIDFTGLAYLAALGVGAFIVYRLITKGPEAAKEAAGAVLQGVNPTNPENVFALGSNAVTQAITGQADDTLGTALWRLFNPAAVAAEKEALSASEVKRPSVSSSSLAPGADGGTWRSNYHGTFGGYMGAENFPNIGGPVFDD